MISKKGTIAAAVCLVYDPVIIQFLCNTFFYHFYSKKFSLYDLFSNSHDGDWVLEAYQPALATAGPIKIENNTLAATQHEAHAREEPLQPARVNQEVQTLTYAELQAEWVAETCGKLRRLTAMFTDDAEEHDQREQNNQDGNSSPRYREHGKIQIIARRKPS